MRLVISLALVFGLFTGCSGDSPDPVETQAPDHDIELPPEPPKPSCSLSPTPESAAGQAIAPVTTDPAPPTHSDSAPQSLLDPGLAKETAPETFRVQFETTRGNFVVEAHRLCAPLGADRFYNLVQAGFYDGVTFFRAIDGFMVQFGIHGSPAVSSVWRDAKITDDPVLTKNIRGTISYAMAGPNTRTSQIFINYNNRNVKLDSMGFSPFASVVEGMEVVDSLHKGYGEGAPRGRGPDQGRIQMEGNAYLNTDFPDLDHVIRATIVQ